MGGLVGLEPTREDAFIRICHDFVGRRLFHLHTTRNLVGVVGIEPTMPGRLHSNLSPARHGSGLGPPLFLLLTLRMIHYSLMLLVMQAFSNSLAIFRSMSGVR